MSSAERIFLVDDDPAVRTSLGRVLRQAGWMVEGFETAEDFLARRDTEGYGCVVLDLNMPGLDGLALQEQLIRTGESLPIVFVTGHGDIPSTVRALKAGAADFLTKPVGAQDLINAVREALLKHASKRQADADLMLLRERFASLTPREREVLGALAEGKLNKQIASDMGIVEQTVKFHRARVMERLQARTVAELMHIAARLGVGPGGH